MSRLSQTHIAPEDFMEFGVDLEELRVINGGLRTIKNHAFRHVRGIKTLDFSENDISQIENDAFTEVRENAFMYSVILVMEAVGRPKY